MTLKKLHTYGCSMVAGSGVKNKNLIWPALVSDSLGIELVNHGLTGGSNKAIWHEIMNTDFDENDLVVIQWTYTTRHCFFIDKHHRIDLRGGMLDQPHITVDKHFLEIFYGDMFTFYDAGMDLLVRANHIHYYLGKKGVRYIMNQVFPTEDYLNLAKTSWNQTEILYLFDVFDLKEKYPLAEDGEHPGYQAHKIMSEAYLTEIQKKIS